MYRGIVSTIARNGRSRRFSSVSQNQAFLEPLVSHPGITCLSLNRPQSKNAISLALLQVTFLPITCKLLLFTLPTSSNSDKAWRMFISTKGAFFVVTG